MSHRPEWRRGEFGMYLDSPYNPEFIEEMKATVPHEDRKWDPEKKEWWISDAWLDEVDALLFQHFESSGYGRDEDM